MAEILHDVPIEGSREAVYKALTEGSEINKWWTTNGQAMPDEGTTIHVEFFGGMVKMDYHVDKLVDGQQIEWTVTGPPSPEWADTRVSWQLVDGEQSQTLLRFAHRDWKSTEGAFPSINFAWGGYLMSLKQYVETGQGMPHQFEG